MILFAVFRHLDHDGVVTGTGYVVRSREEGGYYDEPYRYMAPVWAFSSEAVALRVAEKMTQKMGRC